jgi:hypothetical protein
MERPPIRPAEQQAVAPPDEAFARMHDRLVDYGDCFLRGGEGITFQIYRDDRPEQKPIQYSGRQKDAARLLHRNIIALEIRRSLVLQVFYGESVCRRWDRLNPNTQAEIIDDLTNYRGYPHGVNKRLENRAREARVTSFRIRPDDFMGLRDDAIRQLIRIERATASVPPLRFPCG